MHLKAEKMSILSDSTINHNDSIAKTGMYKNIEDSILLGIKGMSEQNLNNMFRKRDSPGVKINKKEESKLSADLISIEKADAPKIQNVI